MTTNKTKTVILFIVAVIVAVVLLSSCDGNNANPKTPVPDTSYLGDDNFTPEDVTPLMALHRDLKDCRIYKVQSPGSGHGYYVPTLYITRCPESNTSTSTSGKNAVHVDSN